MARCVHCDRDIEVCETGLRPLFEENICCDEANRADYFCGCGQCSEFSLLAPFAPLAWYRTDCPALPGIEPGKPSDVLWALRAQSR